jgi:hypothetical protein
MRCDLARLPGRRLAVAAAAVGLTACGSSGPGGVAVDSLQTNVVFGAEQPVAGHAVASGANPAPAPQVLPAVAPFTIPPTLTFPTFPAGLLSPVGGLCPTASPNTFPAQPTTADVPAPPATGSYRWEAAGTYDRPVGTLTLQLPVGSTFQQFVRHVQPFQDNFPQTGGGQQGLDYTFDAVQPGLGTIGAAYLQFVWQVKSNPAAGDPEGGLALIEVDSLDSRGGTVGTIFKAAAHDGLLLLPLPAGPGPVEPAVVTTVPDLPVVGAPPSAPSTESVDTSGNGNNLQFSGTVGAPQRLDACGTWLEAWPVDGTLRNGPASATLHLDVATQFGALVMALDIDGSFLGVTFHKLTTHVGQAPPPSALPIQWQ